MARARKRRDAASHAAEEQFRLGCHQVLRPPLFEPLGHRLWIRRSARCPAAKRASSACRT